MNEPEPLAVISYREKQIPRSEPLKTLVARLRKPSPPAIDILVDLFRPAAGEKDFRTLIREYLPDCEEDIMAAHTVSDRIETFRADFSDRYFPLWDVNWGEDGEGYLRFTDRCPAELSTAFDAYRYGEIPGSEDPVLITLAYVFGNPWSDRDRPAFAEAAAKILPKKIMELIPEYGFELNESQVTLKGNKKFGILAEWIDVIRCAAGNHWFDCGDMEQDGCEYVASWDRPTVEALTREWQEYEAWWSKFADFGRRFKKDLVKNTWDLIKILKGGESNGEKIPGFTEACPECVRHQGKLFDVGRDGAPLGNAPGPPDTAGRT